MSQQAYFDFAFFNTIVYVTVGDDGGEGGDKFSNYVMETGGSDYYMKENGTGNYDLES
jgi:hypothetical protein